MSTVTAPAPPSRQEAIRALVKAGQVTILDLFDHLSWLRSGADWTAWRAFLCAVYGFPMTEQEYAIFRRHTNRKDPPKRQVREVWAPVGRRGRKSAIAGLIGAYHGACRDYEPYLAPGERGRAIIMSKDKDDAGQIHSYATAIMKDPALEFLLEDEPTTDTIKIANRTELKIRAAKITGGRSRAVILGLLDEVAFFPKAESATPDVEIVRGIRPGMANIPGALLYGLSSPYGQSGLLFEMYDQWFGVESDDVLIWQAATLDMHDTPAIREWVQVQYRDDPIAAAAEVGGHFRKDVLQFVSRDVVKALTIKDRTELAPADPRNEELQQFNYHAFVDVSGGSSDGFTLSICHWDPKKRKVVQDVLRVRKPPFKVKEVTKEYCGVLHKYRCGFVYGDHYAGEWPREEFAVYQISYEPSDATKTDIFRDFLPILNNHDIELLDNDVLFDELISLERRTTPTGKEVIEAPKGKYDDAANSTAGAGRLAYQEGQFMPEAQADEQGQKDTREVIENQFQEMVDSISRKQDEFDQANSRFDY